MKIEKNKSVLASLLGSTVSGVFEIGLFHPLDTTAKRLMNNKTNVNFNNFKKTILQKHHHKGWIRGLPSLYPGLGFATSYKVTQRIYKYTGQNVLKNYFLNNHKSKFESVSASLRDSALEVRWKTVDTTLPQFGYRCEVYGDQACKGAVLAKKIAAVAHARSATLDVSALDLDAKPYYLQVSCVDILGGVSVPHVVRIGKQSKK